MSQMNVRLIPYDDEEGVVLSYGEACLFDTVTTTIEEGDDEDDAVPCEQCVPIKTITKKYLQHVVEYLKIYTKLYNNVTGKEPCSLPKPLFDRLLTFVDKEEWNFIQGFHLREELPHLARAAKYLGFARLVDLCAGRVADFFNTNTVDTCQEMFQVKSLTREEEAKRIALLPWVYNKKPKVM